jgi:hypothetical protein
VLSRLAGVGTKSWNSIREGALHGFQKCSDGRLYHELICNLAAENWELRGSKSRGGKNSGVVRRSSKGVSESSGEVSESSDGILTNQAAEIQQNHHEDTSSKNAQTNELIKERKGKERKREGSVPNGTDADASLPDDDVWATVFREGKKLLVRKTGCTEKIAGQCIHEVKVASKDNLHEVRRFYMHVRDHSIDEPLSFAKAWAKRLTGQRERKDREKPISGETTIDDVLDYQESPG